MLIDFQALFDTSSKATLSRVRFASRVAALFVGACLVVALVIMTPPKLDSQPQAIQAVSMAVLERPTMLKTDVRQPEPIAVVRPSTQPTTSPRVPTPEVKPAKPKPIATRPVTIDLTTPSKAPNSGPSQQRSPTPTPSTSPSNSPLPRIATAPSIAPSPAQSSSSLPRNGSTTGGGTNGPRQLGSSTLGILRARECARLDIRDRPADCPPNDELLRLLAKERGPQYRPENAEGFSRNELAWRGIPPPCLPDGKNMSVSLSRACLRFGNVPSRVRSVQEICEAKGLGGCAPIPSQAAINAALEQVRRQETAKAGN